MSQKVANSIINEEPWGQSTKQSTAKDATNLSASNGINGYRFLIRREDAWNAQIGAATFAGLDSTWII